MTPAETQSVQPRSARSALLTSVATTDQPQATAGNRPRHVPADPMLMAADAAAEWGTALSTFWRHVRDGIAPQPIYLTNRVPRWRLSEIRAAQEARRQPQPTAA
jgi:predicted DNA-binding transcriptional regulator AlpA